MPRLRSIERSKYQFNEEDVELLDTDQQEVILANFRSKLRDGKPHKFRLKIAQYSILILGSGFIIYPHYRRGLNSIMSTLACIMLWCQLGHLYSICNMRDQMAEGIKDMFKSITLNRLRYLVYFYLIIFVLKWYFKWTSYLDWLYLIPGLLGYLVVDQEQSQRNLLIDINQLEKYKYQYKEA